MKEIGGYFELEHFHGKEYHENVLRLNLGRTALTFFAEAVGIHTLWMPRFLCGSVIEKCEEEGISLQYYDIDRQFLPVLTTPIPAGDYLYLVNFYGMLTDDDILSQRELHKNIIVDNTHAFFAKALPGIPTIYSIRKFFGLSDGAYLAPGNLSLNEAYERLEKDASASRMTHILGRYEESASAYYQQMLDNAHALSSEPAKKMSPLTQNLLRGIDYESAKNQREENYAALEMLLGAQNPLSFNMPAGPFAYPFYHPQGMALRRRMAKEKIFVPTYWGNVISDLPEDSLAYDLAANILPLPCDQRCSADDMKTVAAVLNECRKELEKTNA